MQLDTLFIHDSIIKSIIENPETDELTFILDWPSVYDNNVFTEANLVFENVLNYEVHEGPFAGRPTILDLIENGSNRVNGFERTRIKIETIAGFRILYCSNVKLIKVEG